MNDEIEDDSSMVKALVTQAFLDGFLNGVSLYSKPREEYTLAEEMVYQQGKRLAKEWASKCEC